MLHKSKRDKMAEAVKSSYGSHEDEMPEEGVVEIEVMEIGAPSGDMRTDLEALVESWDPQTDEGMQYKEDVEDLLGKEEEEVEE